jgi:hypothetical protein
MNFTAFLLLKESTDLVASLPISSKLNFTVFRASKLTVTFVQGPVTTGKLIVIFLEGPVTGLLLLFLSVQ